MIFISQAKNFPVGPKDVLADFIDFDN